jgi:uncharacterized protein (DUF2147 family)
MSVRRVLFSLIALSAVALPGAAMAASPEGLWLVEDQTGRIKIQKCGNQMWGVIAWQRAPKNDTENPNAAMRNRPLVGTAILIGMKPAGGDRWEGSVYNPRNGKVYDSKMAMLPSGKLQIKGCVMGLLCGGEDWTRVAEDAASQKINCANAKNPVGR